VDNVMASGAHFEIKVDGVVRAPIATYARPQSRRCASCNSAAGRVVTDAREGSRIPF
jgi:hypothetical protein